MNFRDYQQEATKYAAYPNINYPYFALVEEVGEFFGKIAKGLRKEEQPNETDLKKELGDILWNLQEIASIRGWNLQEIAEGNLEKLAARKEAGTIVGEGDNR